MAETPKTLNRYDYVGPFASTLVIDAVNSYFDTNVPATPPAKEIEDYGPQLEAINKSLVQLGSDLGIDTSTRLRGHEFTHIFPADQYHTVNRHFGRREGVTGTTFLSGHIYVSESDSLTNTLGTASHEAIHRVERKSINPRPTDIGLDISQGTFHAGYSNERTGAFNGLRESLIEMTNIDLIRNYWGNYPELPDTEEQPYTRLGYEPSITLMDEIISQAPEPRELFKKLQCGLIIGRMAALRELVPIVGQRGMKELSSMDPYSAFDVRNIAATLGLKDTIDKIDARDTSGLMKWL